MTELDRLPPDQRAVLSLVLDRGRSYGEVAELLGIPEQTVRDRAHAALDALASGAPTGRPPRPPSPRPRAPRGSRSSVGSRRAGALLLGAIVVVIVVVIVLVSGGGKGASTTSTTSASSTSAGSSSTSTSAAKPSLDNTIQLSAPEPGTKAAGTAYVLSEGGRYAFYVAAQGLPPSSGFFYAVWLYNSPSSAEPLGRASNVTSNGRLSGGNPLPSNAGDYAKLIVTRETSTHPKEPGPIVLSGAFSLH